ncbi:hypothetical protein BV882_02430 [Streptomyces sp. 46]|nr:hypothetical protein BV882_02430 [Streptomyces sp. 46]
MRLTSGWTPVNANRCPASDSSDYTDRVRLRDILGDHGSFTSPVTTMAEADHAMRTRRLGVLPVVDEQGSALGILALSCGALSGPATARRARPEAANAHAAAANRPQGYGRSAAGPRRPAHSPCASFVSSALN